MAIPLPETPKPEPIQLWKTQIDHFQRLSQIIQQNHGYLDTSPLGAGKTYTTLAIAAVHRLNILVFGPLSTLSMWREKGQQHGVRIIDAISYQTLRGTTKSGCNHPYLQRAGEVFGSTEYLHQWIQAGLLVVFDEMHNLKNGGTAQLAAAHTIVREIVRANSGSRVALLSASPCDKAVHAESILKVLGLIQNTKLYNYNHSTGKYELLGINEVFDWCSTADPVAYRLGRGVDKIDRKSAPQICYNLYIGVVRTRLSSSMPPPKVGAIKDAKNGYYEMSEEDTDLLEQGEAQLRASTRFDELTGTVNIGKGNWGDIKKALMKIEKAKLNTMARLAMETLTQNPQSKVVLYVVHKQAIAILKELLKNYRPAILNGEVKAKDRDTIIAAFQLPDANSRLIIAHPRVGGIGISLDDRQGDWPRFTFLIPSYDFIDLYQATGRCHRGTTLSTATVRFIYSKKFPGETSILNAIAKKTEVTKNMLYDSEGILFPGDYDLWVEGGGTIVNPLTTRKVEKAATAPLDPGMPTIQEGELPEDFFRRMATWTRETLVHI